MALPAKVFPPAVPGTAIHPDHGTHDHEFSLSSRFEQDHIPAVAIYDFICPNFR
jgi:hypothetical protein